MGLLSRFDKRTVINVFKKECVFSDSYKGQVDFVSFQRVILKNMKDALAKFSNDDVPIITVKKETGDDDLHAWNQISDALHLNSR